MLKINLFTWWTDVLLASFLILSFAFSIQLLINSSSDSFLYETLNKNWHLKYINDIKTFTDREICPDDYEQITLGQWSGYDGASCYCENPFSGQIFVHDDLCKTLPEDKKFYICSVLNEIKPINLTKYLGNIFCVKRSKFTFKDLHYALYQHPQKNYDILNMKDDKDYFNFIRNNFTNFNTLNFSLDVNAIVDIKILNKKEISEGEISEIEEIKLKNYEKTNLTKNHNLYVKRLNKLSNLNSLFDMNNFIVDIHLFNHLWCSFLDFPNKYEVSKNRIDFGFEFCNNFINKDNYLFYNDNFKRTERINFKSDLSVSKSDFYNNDIYEYYQNSRTQMINNQTVNNQEPILIYEKYFSGLGCRKLFNVDSYIANYRSNNTIKTFSILTLLIQITILILFIGYSYFKNTEKSRLMIFMIFVILVMIGVNLFICISSCILNNLTYKTIDEYQNECQNLSVNLNQFDDRTSLIEIQYKEDLKEPFRLNVIVIILQLLTALLICLILVRKMCCKLDESNDDDNIEILEMRQDLKKTFEAENLDSPNIN